MKIRTKAVLAAAAALALSFGGTAAAQADSTYHIYNSGILRATASFQAYGEHIFITDNYADGWGARAWAYWSGQSAIKKDNELGANRTVDWDLTITDGTTIYYKLCVKNGSTELACTSYNPDTA